MPDTNPVSAELTRIESILSDDRKSRTAEIEKLAAAQEETKVRLERIEKAGASPTVADGEKRKLPIAGIIRSQATGNWTGLEDVRELGVTAARDLSVASAGGGGYATPAIYRPDLVDMLTAKSVLNQAGVTQITGIKGKSFTVPTLVSGSTFNYYDENAEIIDGDPVFSQSVATPHIGAAMVTMSRLLVENSDPAAEQIVRNLLSRDGALFQDFTGIFGPGSGAHPYGLVEQSVPITHVDGPITLDLCHDAVSAVESANGMVNLGSTCFVMHPTDWAILRKTKASTAGTYQINPDPTSPIKRSLFGYPVYLSSQVVATDGTVDQRCAIFGDFSQLWHLIWSDFVIETSTEGGDLWKKHQLGLKCVFADDWKVMHTDSFKVLGSLKNS